MLTTTQPIPPSLQAVVNKRAALCGLTPFAVLTALVIDGLQMDAETTKQTQSEQTKQTKTNQ